MCLRPPNGLFPSGSPTKTLYAFRLRALFPAHLILFDLLILIYLAKSAGYGTPRCAAFLNLLLRRLSFVQIFSSAPSFEISAVSVLPLM
jgi:hypothetical protein